LYVCVCLCVRVCVSVCVFVYVRACACRGDVLMLLRNSLSHALPERTCLASSLLGSA